MTRRARIAIAGAAAAIAVALLAPVVAWLLVDPHLELADEYPAGAVLRDSHGDVMRVSLGAGDMDCRPYYAAAADDWIVKAVVAAEDRRFFSHSGVDWLSVCRAFRQNVSSFRRVSGASTLTMQASRLVLPHPRTLFWKGVEAIRAMKIEMSRDKMWIVSQYLNRAPFGSNLVGIEAAAQGWFGKSAKDLGLGEASLLAGLVQSPGRLRPDRHMDRALKRREYVLWRMQELGMITQEQRDGASGVRPALRRNPRPFRNPYFCDWAMREIFRINGRRRGDYTTSLDGDVQERAMRAVNAAAKRGGMSVAAVVMRVKTGEVLVLACSGDYFSRVAGQVNTASSPRPAGSTLKTFLAARALDFGLTTPDERLSDVRKAYRGYNPVNFDTRSRGMVKLSDALVLSLNLPFVQLLQRVGLRRFGTTLRTLGFRHMRRADAEYGLGMSIGNVEVTLVELVGAYGCLARGGTWMAPTPLKASPVGEDGDAGVRVFSDGACWLVADALSGEERAAAALGHVADVKTSRFAWKTGTSSAYRDAWTVAWNPEYVVGVWCGHLWGGFGDTSIVGAEAAAPVCWEIARGMYPADNGPWFPRPADVVSRVVCADSGQPAAPECPTTETGFALASKSPTTLCEMHRRGADGEVTTLVDDYVAAHLGKTDRPRSLAISKPYNNSEFRLLDGFDSQRIVCAVVGNVRDGRLWWFVDGKPLGETVGEQPFVWTPTPGRHRISCSTADGVSAAVDVRVLRE